MKCIVQYIFCQCIIMKDKLSHYATIMALTPRYTLAKISNQPRSTTLDIKVQVNFMPLLLGWYLATVPHGAKYKKETV